MGSSKAQWREFKVTMEAALEASKWGDEGFKVWGSWSKHLRAATMTVGRGPNRGFVTRTLGVAYSRLTGRGWAERMAAEVLDDLEDLVKIYAPDRIVYARPSEIPHPEGDFILKRDTAAATLINRLIVEANLTRAEALVLTTTRWRRAPNEDESWILEVRQADYKADAWDDEYATDGWLPLAAMWRWNDEAPRPWRLRMNGAKTSSDHPTRDEAMRAGSGHYLDARFGRVAGGTDGGRLGRLRGILGELEALEGGEAPWGVPEAEVALEFARILGRIAAGWGGLPWGVADLRRELQIAHDKAERSGEGG